MFYLILISNKFESKNFESIIFYDKNNTFKSDKVLAQREFSWVLTIPKISLNNIEIVEGTNELNLDRYIAHFESSSYLKGNVCLAAHNNGYSNNYFNSIYLLENGDKIYYSFNGIENIYAVNNIEIIEENDLSYLDYSEKDIITLITCIDGSPTKRLCVQGIYIEEVR